MAVRRTEFWRCRLLLGISGLMRRSRPSQPYHRAGTLILGCVVAALCMGPPQSAEAKRYKRQRFKGARDIAVIKIDTAYSQKDARWARDRVGGSNETLRKVGCVVTSVATLFRHMGFATTPKKLNNYLRQHKGYNRRGWLHWLKAQKMTGDRVKLTYNGVFNERRLDRMLARGVPVIVKTRSVRNSIHWMLVVGKRKHQYLVHDPLHRHGRAVTFRRVAKRIYQMRIYEPAPKTAQR